MNKDILLDTHLWIWLVNGEKALPRKIIPIIEQAAHKGQLYLSSISTWEVAMLSAKGRITLGNPCLDWINHAIEMTNIQLLALTPDIAVESAHLPGDFQGDPADRIITATARIKNCHLLTKDKRILAYGKQHFVQVSSG